MKMKSDQPGEQKKDLKDISAKESIVSTGDGKALFDLAEYYFGIREYEKAIDLYLETLKHNLKPIRPRTYLTLAASYLHLARIEENRIYHKMAQEHYRTALRIYPPSFTEETDSICQTEHKECLLTTESIIKESIFSDELIAILETLDNSLTKQSRDDHR